MRINLKGQGGHIFPPRTEVSQKTPLTDGAVILGLLVLGVTHTKKIKDKNHMILSINAKKKSI